MNYIFTCARRALFIAGALFVVISQANSAAAQSRRGTLSDIDLRSAPTKAPDTKATSPAPQRHTVSESRVEQEQTNGQLKARANGSCLRVDPSYVALSEATGGQTHMLDPSEIEHISTLTNLGLKKIRETVFRASGSLSGESREFIIPVDTSVNAVAFTVFVECNAAVTIFSPEGTEAAALHGENLNLRHGRFVKVDAPSIGKWRVQVAGSGIYTLAVQARTEVTLNRFEFVEFRGRPLHEGYFPLRGQPASGTTQKALVEISGRVASARLKLIDLNGTELQIAPLANLFYDEELNRSAGVVGISVPDQEFRMCVEGEDQAGATYLRTIPRTYEPKSSSRKKD